MANGIQEAVEFFRQDAGYTRLFTQLIEKYRSLGRLGGTVTLPDLTTREREVLGAFLRRDYGHRDTVTIAVSEIITALARTRFSHIELKVLLDGYVGEAILTKAEERELYESEKRQYFLDLGNEFQHPHCQIWLADIMEKAGGTRGIHLAYDRDPEVLRRQLVNVLSALEHLPQEVGNMAGSPGREGSGAEDPQASSYLGNDHRGKSVAYERLPVFASRMTGDPHAFDLDTDQGRFFVGSLQAIRCRHDPEYQLDSSPSAEDITELLDYFGLVRDDLLNFVTCAGILGFSSVDNQPLPLWQAAYEAGSVLNVPLREMIKVDTCLPGTAWYRRAKCFGRVFVIENSGVFSAILDAFAGAKELPPLVCTHGQFTLATLLLLDKLAENAVLLYSGDFDPEGLQMAERLLQRYPHRLLPWRYTEADCESVISQVPIPSSRLGKLDGIESVELLPVAGLMLKHRRAGYQEELLDKLISDIKNLWDRPASGGQIQQ